jgi:hypothetical protein
MPSLSQADIPYIMLAAVGVAFVSVVVACVSAFFSWRSTKSAAKAAQATLYVKLQEQYESDQMLQDLRKLGEWRDEQGADFASKWKEQWGSDPKTPPDEHTKAGAVDKSRRHVSDFFSRIADLYKLRLLSKRLASHFANYSGANLWFDVVEPLEEKLGEILGRAYNKSQFDTLRSFRGARVASNQVD